MKKFAIILLMLTAAAYSLSAEHLRERVSLVTDKAVYVAGDKIWCSAWCVDAVTGKLSSFSDIAYVELHDTDGTVQTGKIALENGRGAGTFTLSASLPTGNYQLIAYTAQSCNEVGFDYFAFARTVSVFNTLSNDRIKDGVEVVDVDGYPCHQSRSQYGDLQLKVEESAPESSSTVITLSNTGSEEISLSLSVAHDDGIAAMPSPGLDSFMKGVSSLAPAQFISVRTPEYEGEIIRTRLVGVQGEAAAGMVGKDAFICVPDSKPNIYMSRIGGDFNASFFTDNLYGEKDLFIGLSGVSTGEECHLEAESPFVNPPSPVIPALYMRRDFSEALSLRSAAMQIGSCFDADTLYELLPIHQRLLMESPKTYELDDYTRFPALEEVFIEFIPEVKLYRDRGATSLIVMMTDAFRGSYNTNLPSLMMIDGVPVFDADKFLKYDPLLVRQIDIYQKTYHLGGNIFSGAVNLVTYKGDVTSFQFGSDVRIVNFQGASYPLALTCEGVSEEYPDYRQTIYWHPLITVAPGQSLQIRCKTPAYSGTFEVTAEGLTSGMNPVFRTASFEVRE